MPMSRLRIVPHATVETFRHSSRAIWLTGLLQERWEENLARGCHRRIQTVGADATQHGPCYFCIGERRIADRQMVLRRRGVLQLVEDGVALDGRWGGNVEILSQMIWLAKVVEKEGRVSSKYLI